MRRSPYALCPLLLMLGCRVVLSQPAAGTQMPVSPVVNAHHRIEPPESAVLELASTLNHFGSLPYIASIYIEGVKERDPDLVKVEHELNKTSGYTLTVSDFSSNVKGDTASITFTESLSNHLGMSIKQQEVLQLHRADMGDETLWQIIPDSPDSYSATSRQGFIQHIASFVAYPKEMLLEAQADISLRNIQQLSLSILQLAQDNDETINVTSATIQKELAPYLPVNTNFFQLPGSQSGTPDYSINPFLEHLGLAAISEPAQTVMVFESKDDSLHFRYNGRAAVGFADGHAKLVTPEEAKTLRWKP